MGRLRRLGVCAACAPRELGSDCDCVLGLFAADAVFGNLRKHAVDIHHARKKESAVQNVVETVMVTRCYDMRLLYTTMRDLFAFPVNRICLRLCDVWIGVLGLTSNWYVAVLCVTRSNTNELVIVPAL